jgi:hypothetical protein
LPVRWLQDSTMAAPTHPYLPTSFPFARGKEEHASTRDQAPSPAHGGRLGRGLLGAAIVVSRNDLQRQPPHVSLRTRTAGKAEMGGLIAASVLLDNTVQRQVSLSQHWERAGVRASHGNDRQVS